MQCKRLDDFASVKDWVVVTSGQAELKLSRDTDALGAALRMDFDFHGGGGFVVARKVFGIAVQGEFTFGFRVRGACVGNNFEFKLADTGGENVWRWRREGFEFGEEWKEVSLDADDIEFAWGPAGGGSIRQIGAIEFVIAAGEGGKGSVWITDLCFTERGAPAAPLPTASSAQTGHEARHAMDDDAGTSWRAAPGDLHPWLALDFQEERRLGGLVVRWETRASQRGFRVETSADAISWSTVYASHRAQTALSYVPLPKTRTRHLRLCLDQEMSQSGIVEIKIKPEAFSRDDSSFFHAIAADAPRGHYPRYWLREQSYWTPIGHPSVNGAALMNEEGMVEAGIGGFSLEPFLWCEDGLQTWADGFSTPELLQGWMPAPSVRRETKDWALHINSWMSANSPCATLHVSYRVRNTTPHPHRARLLVAARPFQVTPPWQHFRQFGGVSAIHLIEWKKSALWVNGAPAVYPIVKPDAVGVAAFEQGAITEFLANNDLPADQTIEDESGWASGALAFDFHLSSGETCEFGLLIPWPQSNRDGASRLPEFVGAEITAAAWAGKLPCWRARLPESDRDLGSVVRSAAAHILVNRDGAALQPGPRRYTRSWIRDGAIMAAALLRAGCAEEAQAYVRWYAPFIREDGMVPCCVDRSGPDWLAEYDSQGQFIFAVRECHRFTRDDAFLNELWPSVRKAVKFIEALRLQRLTREYDIPENLARRGLLPESVSHEGYLSQPVHSYWDDFWALRGLGDAMEMAEMLKAEADARWLAKMRDDLGAAIGASMLAVISQHGLDYVPASVEWADFDPTATANAIMLFGPLPGVPDELTAQTFSKYLEGFRARRSGAQPWNNYSPYEIRIIGALARLGRTAEALELMDFFLSDRRPIAWNQWPEIAWKNPRSPGHLGDLPHTWIAAEFILAAHELIDPVSA